MGNADGGFGTDYDSGRNPIPWLTETPGRRNDSRSCEAVKRKNAAVGSNKKQQGVPYCVYLADACAGTDDGKKGDSYGIETN